MNQHHTMPHISLESPVTHNSWEDGKYTTYDIVVNCEDDSCPLFALPRSSVSRRYREFRWLRKRLCAVSSIIVRRIPQLPTVGCPLFDDRFSPDFIENRRRGLEEFLQGVCAIPTLLSEAALHLFAQTDLNTPEIDAYVDRKWGKREEVYDVVTSLNRQKQTEERDEIASMASVGRWSEASVVDAEDDDSLSNTSGASSSANNTSNGSLSTKPPGSAKKSQSKARPVDNQMLVTDAEVISPVLGLYLPIESEEENSPMVNTTAPVVIRSNRIGGGHNRIAAASMPVALETNRRRSRSVQIHHHIPNNEPSSFSTASSLSPGSYQQRHLSNLSSSLSPTNGELADDEDALKSPTSLDIYNSRRNRRGKSPASAVSPKNVPYYCSNAVWLSSASGGSGNNHSSANGGVPPRRLRAASPAMISSGGSRGTSSLSPASSAASTSSSAFSANGGRT